MLLKYQITKSYKKWKDCLEKPIDMEAKSIAKNFHLSAIEPLELLEPLLLSPWKFIKTIWSLVYLVLWKIHPKVNFYPLKTPKIKILKIKKFCWRYHHFIHMYQKSQSYDVQFLRYRVRQTAFFVILGHFLPFYHSLIIYTINDNHMYVSWDMERIRNNLDRFWYFYPLMGPRKSKFWKNEKNTWIYYHFANAYHKWQSCDVWFLKEV